MAWLTVAVTPMFRLRVESEFDAAHQLEGYEGKCSRLHGHTYRAEAFLLTENLDAIGVSFDLRTLRQKLAAVTEPLDHNYLNDLKELGNPSTENIARYIYLKLKADLPIGLVLEKVRVWETPKSWIEYFER
jgi:6-pyruvoyltetrahydropterin/6-carboxytetrahydropterin synthase